MWFNVIYKVYKGNCCADHKDTYTDMSWNKFYRDTVYDIMVLWSGRSLNPSKLESYIWDKHFFFFCYFSSIIKRLINRLLLFHVTETYLHPYLEKKNPLLSLQVCSVYIYSLKLWAPVRLWTESRQVYHQSLGRITAQSVVELFLTLPLNSEIVSRRILIHPVNDFYSKLNWFIHKSGY